MAIILFSTFTAFLTNALDASDDNIGNIAGKRVAIIEGSTGETFARQRGAKLLVVETLGEAIENLDSGMVSGVVFDGPALQYYLKNYPDPMMEVYLYNESSESYGFVSNININADILEMKENGQIQSIKSRWLSDI